MVIYRRELWSMARNDPAENPRGEGGAIGRRKTPIFRRAMAPDEGLAAFTERSQMIGCRPAERGRAMASFDFKDNLPYPS